MGVYKLKMVERGFVFKNVEILFDESLGSGAYGSVYRAKCDHLPCAAKILHPMFFNSADPAVTETIARFRGECKLLSSLQHPNIVQFLGEFTNTSGQTALVMELMDESLTAFLDRYDPLSSPVPTHLIIDFSHDISLALYYLHNNGIIHRDLTSNNILLLRECRAKVTDLGVSKLQEAHQYMTQCPGAPVYMPPEALSQVAAYSEKLDCFSFGVLLIQMASCRFPQPDPNETLINDSSSPTGFVRMPVKEMNRRAKDLAVIDKSHILRPLMIHCIEDRPCNRPTSSELCEHLEKMKIIPEYIQSKINITNLSSVSSLPTSEIDEKMSEIQSLRQDRDVYEEKLRGQELLLQQKEGELAQVNVTQTEIENKLMDYRLLLQTRERELEKEREKSTEIEQELRREREKVSAEDLKRATSTIDTALLLGETDPNTKVIKGLDSNIIALLSKSKTGELKGVIYDSPEPGNVTVISTPTESLSSRIGLVLNAYRRLIHMSSFDIDFIVVPSSFPQEEVYEKTDLYNQNYPSCHLCYIEDLQVVQIMSLQFPVLLQVKELWEKEWMHTIFMSGKRKLILKKTDIVKEPVSVIVSATNRRLNLNGGMSKAINAASGGKIQQFCEEYIKKNGYLEECGICKTPSAGDLKCRWIIYAVGPDGTKYSSSILQDKMRDLITKCLVQADKLGAQSVAIPPIGTGHYHIDRKLAANAIIAAVMDYDYLNDETLREIVICVIDDQTFKDFADVFSDRRVNLEYMQSCSSPEFLDDLMESGINTPLAPSNSSSCKSQ